MMLGKAFTDKWYFTVSYEEKGRQLQSFLSEHSDCCKGLEHDTCGGISPFNPDFEPFELVYENREEWGHQQTFQERDKELHPDKYKSLR